LLTLLNAPFDWAFRRSVEFQNFGEAHDAFAVRSKDRRADLGQLAPFSAN
jgi:hypothetical protein